MPAAANPPPQPHPISVLGWIRASYYKHVRTWLVSQDKRWDASMLATKLGYDIEAQIIGEGRALQLDNLMRAVVSLHAELVFKGFSLSRDQSEVWRDTLKNANPRLRVIRPRLQALLDDPGATQDHFLAEFDAFVREEKLNDKTVVLMNCPESPRWALQNI